MNMNALLTLRRGNVVTRYHTETTLKEETVGHHSANTAATLMYMWGPKDLPPAEVLAWAITHDVGEQHVGDVPAPAKWASKNLGTLLNDLEASWANKHGVYHRVIPELLPCCRFANIIDCMFKGVEEINLGNLTMISLAQRAYNAAYAASKEIPQDYQRLRAEVLLTYLNKELVKRGS